MIGVEAVLTGHTDEHLVRVADTNHRLHREAVGPFEKMRAAAKRAGFEISIASSYRDFKTQMRIWNEKATGKRPVLDAAGKPLDVKKLRPDALVEAILRWSALPGLSRHHWGTDFDVFDAKQVEDGYRVQLTPEESDGKFGKLHAWLDTHLAKNGFFRPYATDLGGVSPERWHLSYAPVADVLKAAHSVDIVTRAISPMTMELKPAVLEALPSIFERYFLRISESFLGA